MGNSIVKRRFATLDEVTDTWIPPVRIEGIGHTTQDAINDLERKCNKYRYPVPVYDQVEEKWWFGIRFGRMNPVFVKKRKDRKSHMCILRVKMEFITLILQK